MKLIDNYFRSQFFLFKKNNLISFCFFSFIVLTYFIPQFSLAQDLNKCATILNEIISLSENSVKSSHNTALANDLVDFADKRIALVPEFLFINMLAEKMGMRVWLFGGTASSFLHYVKWDLLRLKKIKRFQKDRFDYDYTNIFRSTQDLEIVVDSTPEVALKFQTIIGEKYPHFLGSKAKWEVRTLRHRIGTPGELGFKEALLNDPDFSDQNTDSNSIGMVEITQYKNEPRIKDLKNWDSVLSVFLEDTLKSQICFFRSSKHYLTLRSNVGENPEILSVIRFLVKAFQYELTFSESDYKEIKNIINEFDVSQVTNQKALRRIHDTAKKLVLNAVNIEYALNKLEELGLKQKIIAMGDARREDTDAWWLNREPLRSFPIGEGIGSTASDLNITVVAHDTKSFLAYESIARSHSGEPNVLISRQYHVGETAIYGDGFYTRMGTVGAVGTGMTIRFFVDPKARNGTDFKVVGDYIIFKNKKALSVIQESLNFGINDLLKFVETDQDFQL